ncbi:hypothetical protein P8F35_000770, partial [Salmonella enterica]|nr:hypothetical protein [Salmonella enterica]
IDELLKIKSPAATSAQGKSAVGVTVRLWDYGHKKAPTKSGQGSHVENDELPVMELRCRVPPGKYMDDQPVTCVSSTAFSALNEMVGLRPSAQGDSPQQN